MSIIQFGLTAEQILKRREGIGGSDANIIMGGDQAAILRLWEEKTGQREGEDLSRVLPVQMGTWTEPLNRHWYTLTTGNEVQVCEGIVHPQHKFMRCLLDGFVPAEDAIFEAKHVNQFAKADQVAQKYMGQLHHNMACAGKTRAVLSIFIGTMTYEHFMVEADPFYTATLIEAEEAFWNAVQTMTPPGEMPAPLSPTLPTQFRTVDMTGRNEWASHADNWLRYLEASRNFTASEKALKGMIEQDVSEAFGHGIRITRAKNGALTIREAK